MESFDLEIWYFTNRDDKDITFVSVKAKDIEEAVEKAKEIIKHPFRIFYKNYKVYPL